MWCVCVCMCARSKKKELNEIQYICKVNQIPYKILIEKYLSTNHRDRGRKIIEFFSREILLKKTQK